ncbi:nitrilase-related carbon-nitrogen hydrolase [Phorcysia thermohydrogeniphila]|uniref:nitrilase-related carbon-nitrogen hydrolase n=1 Tax=Phorcysia thermohydrogeniphila TaxID=936138 RepID=UPI001FB42EBF|nr:nitrilase-related carbon-nitrogen hydrolase [Phorcysia thermohydrogeniphila]
MKKTFKAFAIQFETTDGQFERNYTKFLTFFNLCEKESLVVAPEVFPTGFFYSDMDLASEFSKKVVDDIAKFSEGMSLTVVFTVIEKVNGKFFNSIKVIDRGKEVLSRPKVKLFPLTGETEQFSAGDVSDLKVAETSCGVIAPVICFELRYPEIFKLLKEMGAQVFAVSAQWGRARKEHWRVLTSARSIENQRFLVASNGTGEMAGNSVIVDPWGRVLAQGGEAEGIISGKINLSVIEQVEKKLPME